VTVVRRWVSRHPGTTGFVLFVLLVSITLGSYAQTKADAQQRELEVQRREQEAQRQALVEVCRSNATLRIAVRDFVASGRPMPIPPGADPALASAIAEANRRSDEARRRVNEQFADPPCVNELPGVLEGLPTTSTSTP
jgi:hypothetical protein